VPLSACGWHKIIVMLLLAMDRMKSKPVFVNKMDIQEVYFGGICLMIALLLILSYFQNHFFEYISY